MDRTRRRLLSEQLPKEKAYWLDKLAGDLALSGIPLDLKRPDVLSPEKNSVAIDLDPQSAGKLFKATKQNELLIFTILVTTLKICLFKYNGVEDVIVGTTIHKRHKEDALLNQVLVLRDQVSRETTSRQLLKDIKNTIYEAFSHQKFPFESILELLHITAPENRMPLFNVVVLLDNLHSRENISDLENDVTVIFSIKEGHLTGSIEYNPGLFKEKTLASFARHYDNVLRAIITNPDQKISAIELLSQEEKQELIFGFNNTDRDYPRQKLIHQLFEEQVQQTPQAMALVSEEESLTYEELNERANQVAGYLRELGVGPEVLVGVMLERSAEMVVGLLGVLKAGGAYVPLDVQYPQERIGYMLEDTGAPVLLTQQRLLGQLPEHKARTVCIDSQWGEISRHSRGNPERLGTADNLAYVIYTSGSTGKPKGICLTHKGISRLVLNTNYVQLSASDRVGQLSNSSFDAAIFEIWGGLLNGARLEIIRKEVVLEPGALRRQLRSRGITTVMLTTALFNQVVAEDADAFQGLKHVFFGAEEAEPKWVRAVLKAGRPERLGNVYGPTENTTLTSWYEIKEVAEGATTVPIGSPVSNTEVYILNEAMSPVPVGVRGELYTGGDWLHTARCTEQASSSAYLLRVLPHDADK